MAGDDDVPGYSGNNSAGFRDGIELLSQFYVESIPQIFLKTREIYSKLKPSFPYLKSQPKISSYDEDEQDRNLRQQLLTALAAAEVVQNAIELGEADRNLNNEIDQAGMCAELLIRFRDKIKKRLEAADTFQLLTGSVGSLSPTFPGSQILKLILEYDVGTQEEKTETKRKVLSLYSAFEAVKENFNNLYSNFVSHSEFILTEEGAGIVSTFLNYREFDKLIKIGDVSVQQALAAADKTWTDILKKLAEVTAPPGQVPVPAPVPAPVQQASEVARGEPEKDILKIFRKKEEALMNYIQKWVEVTDLSEQDCADIKLKVSRRAEELEELSFKIDPIPESQVFDQVIDLNRNLNKISAQVRTRRELEDEERRVSRQEEIRSLPRVNMPKLRSAADYLHWRQSHQYILTTTSSFKKAQLLLNSIEDKEVKARCAGLIDPDEILMIVASMRSRTSQLIPALLKNLRDMKAAHSMSDISRVAGMILNHYSQLQSLGEGALSYLTASVIDELITKLPKEQQYEFEKFLDDKDVEEDNPSECGFSTAGELQDAYELVKDATPLEIGKRDKNYRIYFIKFVKKLEKQHLNVTARINNNRGPFTESSTRQSGSGASRSHPKKGGVFAVDEQSSSCVVCGSTKGHKNQKGYFTKSLVACKKFRDLKTNAERKKIILSNKFCQMCLSPGCDAGKCRITGDCHACKKHRHNKWICTVKMNAPSSPRPSSPLKVGGEKEDAMALQSEGRTRLIVGNGGVKAQSRRVHNEVLFFDPGSTLNLILHKKAKELGYKGVPVTVDIRRAGLDYEPTRTLEYSVTLVTNGGEEVTITALGIDSLTSAPRIPRSIILKTARRFGISPSQLNNAEGPSAILIGAKSLSLHPKLVEMKGELGLFRSSFGRPFWLAGNLGDGKTRGKEEAHFIDHLSNTGKDHFNQWARIDQLGLNTDPKCAICIKTPPCKSCAHLETPLSFKEQSEGELIKKSMTFDFEKKKVSARFPFLRDPAKVFPPGKSNKNIAERMATNLIKSLKKEDKLKVYTECFAEQIERGVMRELSEEEMEAWERGGNPVNYCSHHPVEKASSSTPCRPVVNSSTYHNGITLNEILAKGPTAISNLYHVLLRSRAKPFLIIGDLRKAYHEISLPGDTEIHLRRMLWIDPKDVDKESPRLRTYALLCAAFGDRPSGFYLENSKMVLQEWTAKQGDQWVPAQESLIKNSYVDDFIPSTDTLEEANDLKAKVPVIFSQLGFKFKDIRVIGPGVIQPPDTVKETLVGYLYDSKDDTIRVNFKVNLSVKKRSMRQGEDLKEESQLDSIKWTKTNLASLVASQYDPLGLASVYLQQGRILVSQVAKKGYNWKDVLDEEDSKKVRKYAEGLLGLVNDPPVFPRAVCPVGYELKVLVCFVDASSLSLHVTLYGIFYGPEGAVCSSLLGGKGAIIHGTVPSNELFALLAGNRVVSNYIQATEPNLEKICIMSDSQASLDQLNDTFSAKDVLTRNKLRNIWKYHSKLTCPMEYFHVPSDEMTPADMGTRSNCPASYLKTEEYQKGPAWILNIGECDFAVLNHTIPVNATPVLLGDVMNVEVEDSEPSVPHHPFLKMLSRVSRLPLAARVVCIVRSVFKNKSFRRPQMVYTHERLSSAFLDLVKVSQEAYPVDNLAVKQLLVYTDPESGVVFTSQRCPKDVMDNLFATSRLPVLAPRSRLAELALMFAHEEQILTRGASSHFGLKQTLVHSRSNQYACFVVQGRRAAKSLISRCVLCKKNNRVLQDALIAERKGGLGAPPPPDGSCFNKISMDYQGPVFTKLPKGRLTRNSKFYKQWLMIIVCQQTRAVSIVPCEGYHVEAFQTAFSTHCAMHGVPAQVNSDPMSAFVRAAKELNSEINLSDYSSIFENLNIEWNFIPPGAQHRNGTCERIVRSVKQMLKFLSAHTDSPALTAGELWLLSRSCSEILNRRPLSATVADGEVSIISPNDLILGRPSRHMVISQGDNVSLRDRIKLVRDLTSRFWKRMQEELVASPHLFKAQKWNTSQRKPRKNDILLVVYKSKIQDDFRIGVVQEVLDERTVRVKVSPVQAGNLQPPKPCGTLVVPLQRTVYLYHEDDDNHLTDHQRL